ncbi:MAG: hypothetical protein HOQ28_19560 [Thermoleophilia bacterium]|nr:hypothetical protein [Thermoleophilia bacterium]
MATIADKVLHHLGGTSAVAAASETPVSTVHSWRKIGISSSRMNHLRLVAKEMGKPLPDDLGTLPDPPDEAPAPDAEAA